MFEADEIDVRLIDDSVRLADSSGVVSVITAVVWNVDLVGELPLELPLPDDFRSPLVMWLRSLFGR